MRAADFAPGDGDAPVLAAAVDLGLSVFDLSGVLLADFGLSAALDLADAFAFPLSAFGLAAALARAGVDFDAAAGAGFLADGFAAAALSLDGFFDSLAASTLGEPTARTAMMATAVLAMRKRELVNGRSSLLSR